MDLSLRVGSDGKQENQSSHKGKRACSRHAPETTIRLEEIFKEIKHPSESLRCEIGKELGLDPKQVKFWFQNRRTSKKTQDDKVVNSALRFENEMMLNENILLREALNNIFCPACSGGPPCINHVEHELFMTQLQLENVRLKEEHERVSKLLARYMDNIQNPWLEPEFVQLAPPITESSFDPSLAASPKFKMGESAPLNLGVGSSSTSSKSVLYENVLPKPTSTRIEMEKTIMLEVAMAAKEELLKLLCINEPLWVKSQSDGKLALHDINYDKVFPRVNHFNGTKARVESSKDSRIVTIEASQLVDMFLDSEKWNNLFSTIVTKAQTIEVLENGSSENRSGALLLMYEEMHVLSPLLPSREFYFLRYCEQVEAGIWVIADVSYDYLKENGPHSCTWKFPSGCIIHQISTASSQVSWVEHVEVDGKIQTHCLYRDLVNSTIAFGADRWLMELQRMSERFSSATANYIPPYDNGVVTLPGGRRSVMQLSHRMVKSFCASLTMSSKMDFPVDFQQHMIDNNNNSGVRFSIQKTTYPHPKDMIIVTVASSFSLGLSSQTLFDFFRDPKKRFQWDVLCCGNQWHEVAHISSGTHPNYISIIEPVELPHMNGVVIIQESFINPLGSFVVYSPVNVSELKIAISGQDSSTVSILPSGIVISEDSQSLSNAQISSSSSENGGKKTRGGSLLTVALQVLMSSPAIVNLESMANVNSLMTSTVESIKNALLNDSVLE